MKKLAEILARLTSAIPDPKCELVHQDAYTLLVASILSAQSTDKRVNIVTQDLFVKARTPKEMLILGSGLKEVIKTIGLAETKARNILKMSYQLLENFQGQVPDNLQDLVSLAGVGPKTARIVLVVWFKKPFVPVDTHIMRVVKRLDLTDLKNPEKISLWLEKYIPFEYGLTAHNLLVLHGRYTCKALKPQCADCVLQDICPKNGVKQ